MIFLKLFFALHFLGDFYISMDGKEKKRSFLPSSLLAASYCLPFTVVFFLVEKWIISLIFIVIIFIAHLLIKFFKRKYESHNPSLLKPFLMDQGLHLLVLMVSWSILREYFIGLNSIDAFLLSFDLQVNSSDIISISLVFLVIFKPTSQFIELLLRYTNEPIDEAIYDSSNSLSKLKKEVNNGVLIGYLERITIVILGLLNLWSSIALVITAKSIARFKQLEDKDFAQKYLIGTLLSFCITLALLLVFAKNP